MIGSARLTRAFAPISLIAVTASMSSPGASQPGPAADRCEALTGLEIRPGVTIASARHGAAAPALASTAPGAPPTPALPAHCRVEGTMDPHRGADGREYAIGFALALPDEWNGRFLLQGGGGLNGSVGEP